MTSQLAKQFSKEAFDVTRRQLRLNEEKMRPPKFFCYFFAIMAFLGVSKEMLAADSMAPAVFRFISKPKDITPRGELTLRMHFLDDILASSSWRSEEELKLALKNNDPKLKEYLKLDPHGNTIWNNELSCGKFEQISIGTQKKLIAERKMPGGGSFNVVEGSFNPKDDKDSWFAPLVDVGYLQALPENKQAVFQLASNFSGLEAVSPFEIVSERLLKRYSFDKTQGPAAAISAAPGLLLRRYFDKHFEEINSSAWGQTEQNPINFLDAVSKKVWVTNAGYVKFVESIWNPENAPTDEDYDKLKIGFHSNIQVTFGGSTSGYEHYSIKDESQIIHQALVAAIDFRSTNKEYFPDVSPLETHLKSIPEQWAQRVLDLAYEGTLRQAYLIGAKKVFLTMVGAGAFANKTIWILNAIKSMEQFIADSGMEVILILRSRTDDENLRQSLFAIVEKTNGTYFQYTDDGVFQLDRERYDNNY